MIDTRSQVQVLLDTHVKELREVSNRVRAFLIEEGEVQQTLRELMQNIAVHQERWEEFAHSARMAVTIKPPDLARLDAQLREFQEAMQRAIGPAFDAWQQWLHKLPPPTRKAVLKLGAHGWFFDVHVSMSDLWALERALVEGDVEVAEASLCRYFESKNERIEATIIARFPQRAHIISAAFSAHRREEYVLSIPILLAQTDGICKEVIGQYLFMKKDKKPCTSAYVEQVAADSLAAAILSPLAQTLPINASEKERPEGTDALNRHEVLHGNSLDYGTASNSLKAISLINYVVSVLYNGPEMDA